MGSNCLANMYVILPIFLFITCSNHPLLDLVFFAVASASTLIGVFGNKILPLIDVRSFIYKKKKLLSHLLNGIKIVCACWTALGVISKYFLQV